MLFDQNNIINKLYQKSVYFLASLCTSYIYIYIFYCLQQNVWYFDQCPHSFESCCTMYLWFRLQVIKKNCVSSTSVSNLS